MTRIVNMFPSLIDDLMAVTNSAVVEVAGEGFITLTSAGAEDTFDGADFTVQVSTDDGETWVDLTDQAGATPVIDEAGESFMFRCDGGLLRVSPGSLGASTSITTVQLVGDILRKTAPVAVS